MSSKSVSPSVVPSGSKGTPSIKHTAKRRRRSASTGGKSSSSSSGSELDDEQDMAGSGLLGDGEAEALLADAKEDLAGQTSGKRRRTNQAGTKYNFETTRAEAREQAAHVKSAVDDVAWKAFQDQSDHDSNVAKAPPETRTIEVPRTFRFAGEDVLKYVTLPVNHPDAVSHLARLKQAEASRDQPSGAPHSSGSTPNTAPPSNGASVTTSASSLPAPVRAGPRKKRGGGLAALASRTGNSAPSKMTTLEKSKMDWDSFKGVATSGALGRSENAEGLTEAEVAEMEAQTRGGASGLGNIKGYLERRDFLDRVSARTEAAEEGAKGDASGRRR